jgi:uncharacterized membrane protein
MSLTTVLRSFQTALFKNWKALIILSAMIIGVAGMTLVIAGRNHLYDPSLYHQYSQNIFSGKTPYCDFQLEYPPLSLLPMVIPQLLTLGKTTHLYVYAGLFAVQILIYSLICVLVLARFKRGVAVAYPKPYLIGQGVFLIILSPLLLWRYDVFPGLISLLALVSATSFPLVAGVLMAIGFAAKLYPILGIPFFALFYFLRKKYRDLKEFLLGFFCAVALSVIPFLIQCPNQFYESIRFHQLRGVQIGSIPASLLLLGNHLLDLKIEIIKNYGAEHLKTPLAEPFLKIFPIVFILTYFFLIYCFIRSMNQYNQDIKSSESLKRDSHHDLLIGYTILAIAVFIVTNKVFSTQYLMWLAPIVPLLSRKLQLNFLMVCIAHNILYPFLYDGLVKLDLLPILVLSTGNALMVYFAFQLFSECISTRQGREGLTIHTN